MLARLRLLFLKPFALLANWYFKHYVPLQCHYFDEQASNFSRLHFSKSEIRIRLLENSTEEQKAVQKLVFDNLMSIVGNFTPFTIGTRASRVISAFVVAGGVIVSVLVRKILGILNVLVLHSAISNVLFSFLGILTAYMVAFTLFPYIIFFNYLSDAKEKDMAVPYEHYTNNDFNRRRFFVVAIKPESDPNNEVIVGTFAVHEPDARSPFDPATDAEIRRVSITPAARGQGIARMLCDRIETFAREVKNVKRIVLSTSSLQHKAIAMYKHFGFRELIREPVLGGVFHLVYLTKSIR